MHGPIQAHLVRQRRHVTAHLDQEPVVGRLEGVRQGVPPHPYLPLAAPSRTASRMALARPDDVLTVVISSAVGVLGCVRSVCWFRLRLVSNKHPP